MLRKGSKKIKNKIIEEPEAVEEEEFKYAKVSCCCLEYDDVFRNLMIRLMENKWFDRFIIACIMINSGLLASK